MVASAADGLDVCMIRPKLWLGSAEAAKELKALAGKKISHVLSLGSEFPAQLPLKAVQDAKALAGRTVEGRSSGGRSYLQAAGKADAFVRFFVPVEDSSSADLAQHFDECRMFISEGIAQGGVLVHCSDGSNRAAALLTAFLMMKEKSNVAKALAAVQEKRPSASPTGGLVDQLRALEDRLGVAASTPEALAKLGVLKRAAEGSGNPAVFLEIAIEGNTVGRLEVELLADVVPRTAENFRCLCTGERGRGESGKRLNFLGSIFHRIVPGVVCVGGDITIGNGTGGESIFGHMFEDENFDVKHDARGVLSMANTGPDSNGSQFFVCLRPAPELDGKNVAFARITSGLDVLQQMEDCGGEGGEVTKRVVIMDCGEIAQGSVPKKPKSSTAGEVVHVLHILRKHRELKKPTSWRQETVTRSKQEASEHLSELRGSLQKLAAADRRPRFEDLAVEFSDCKSAKKHRGDLGPFERDMMQKPFEVAAFALPVGGLSEVVSSKLGEHLILRIA